MVYEARNPSSILDLHLNQRYPASSPLLQARENQALDKAVAADQGLCRERRSQEPVLWMQTVHLQTQCVQSLVSVSVSATNQEIRSVGGRERVSVVVQEERVMKIQKRQVAKKTRKEHALQVATVPLQTRCVQSLVSVSVSVINLGTRNAGGRERVSVLIQMERVTKMMPQLIKEMVKIRRVKMKQTKRKKAKRVHAQLMVTVPRQTRYAQSLVSVSVIATNLGTLSAGGWGRVSVEV